MNPKYYVEIADGATSQYCFSYIDTEDNLAALLFDHLKVDMQTDMVFQMEEDDPYRVVMVRIPRHQRGEFLWALDLLPGFMAYAGYEDYEEYCRAFFLQAHLYFRKNAGNITRL